MKRHLGAKTLAIPTPVWVVGTYDREGKPNLMTAAWGGICCSRPPCIYVSLRKATYSYGNIRERKAFTVSVPQDSFAKQADYIGLVSGRNIDKFDTLKLTPVKSRVVDAPYVKEFPLVLECKVIKTIKIGLHTQFIGEIIDVKADPSVLSENGLPDMQKVRPMLFDPGNSTYHGVGAYLGQAFSIGKELSRSKLKSNIRWYDDG